MNRNYTRNNNNNSGGYQNGHNHNNKYRNVKRGPRYSNPGQSLQKCKQSREKYITLAREALASGDPVEAEGHFQHADHYTRLINALLRERNVMEQEQIIHTEETEQPARKQENPESTYEAAGHYHEENLV